MKRAASLVTLTIALAAVVLAQERKPPLNGKWFMTAAMSDGEKETKSGRDLADDRGIHGDSL